MNVTVPSRPSSLPARPFRCFASHSEWRVATGLRRIARAPRADGGSFCWAPATPPFPHPQSRHAPQALAWSDPDGNALGAPNSRTGRAGAVLSPSTLERAPPFSRYPLPSPLSTARSTRCAPLARGQIPRARMRATISGAGRRTRPTAGAHLKVTAERKNDKRTNGRHIGDPEPRVIPGYQDANETFLLRDSKRRRKMSHRTH